jgi:hypothetical protein
MRLSLALRKPTYQYMSLLAHIFIRASLLAIIFLRPVEHTEAYGYVSQNQECLVCFVDIIVCCGSISATEIQTFLQNW